MNVLNQSKQCLHYPADSLTTLCFHNAYSGWKVPFVFQFNLAIKDIPEVTHEAKKALAGQLPAVGRSMCVEISLKTSEVRLWPGWCINLALTVLTLWFQLALFLPHPALSFSSFSEEVMVFVLFLPTTRNRLVTSFLYISPMYDMFLLILKTHML